MVCNIDSSKFKGRSSLNKGRGKCIISGRDAVLVALLITPVSGCDVRGHHMFNRNT